MNLQFSYAMFELIMSNNCPYFESFLLTLSDVHQVWVRRLSSSSALFWRSSYDGSFLFVWLFGQLVGLPENIFWFCVESIWSHNKFSCCLDYCPLGIASIKQSCHVVALIGKAAFEACTTCVCVHDECRDCLICCLTSCVFLQASIVKGIQEWGIHILTLHCCSNLF